MGRLMLENASVQARLEGVGVVTREQPAWIWGSSGRSRPGLRGGAGRPARPPYGIFRFAHIPVATGWAGDVPRPHARAVARGAAVAGVRD